MMLKHKENASIFDKVFGFFIGIFLVILIIGIIFSVVIDGFMKEKVLNDREGMLNEAINNCEYLIKENSEVLLSLTEDETIRYILREYDQMSLIERFNAEKEITQISNSFTIMRPEIAQIKIFMENVAQQIEVNDSIYDVEWLRNDEKYKNILGLRASKVTDYTLMNSGEKNEGRMAIISQIIDFNGKVLGYMCVEINKSVLYKRCVSDVLTINKYIVDETGKPIITPGNDGNVLYDDIIGEFKKTGRFTYKDIEIDGKKYVALGSASSGHGWKVVDIEKSSDFYSWRNSFILIIIFVFFILVIVFAMIAYKLSSSISKPIIQLSEAMESSKVAKESQEYKEIKILQNKYNYLLNSQKEHIKEIEKYSAKQREAEIRSMIAQINPHFVFNTLNSIAYKALEEEQAELCTMVGKLGKLCKISYNLHSFLTTVDEEIMYVSLYMDLQKLCFGNNFNYEIDVPDEFGKIRMPRFILQPFVENSIVHGFANIKYEGHIKIKVSIEEKDLVFSIVDNGNGMDDDIMDKLNKNTYNAEKYGIRNVKERIEQLCGPEYGVDYIKQSKRGTSVVITLPGKGDENVYSSYN